jgi:hypothetical protein
VSGYTSAYLTCNGRDLDPDSATMGSSCPAKVEGGEHGHEWVVLRTVAEARELARKLGWTFVRWPYRSNVSLMSEDYCPAHRDQAQAKADEWGVKITRSKPKEG